MTKESISTYNLITYIITMVSSNFKYAFLDTMLDDMKSISKKLKNIVGGSLFVNDKPDKPTQPIGK